MDVANKTFGSKHVRNESNGSLYDQTLLRQMRQTDGFVGYVDGSKVFGGGEGIFLQTLNQVRIFGEELKHFSSAFSPSELFLVLSLINKYFIHITSYVLLSKTICYLLYRVWPQYVRDRVRATYTYFGASCVATAASAVAIYRSPLGHRFFAFCSRHPIMVRAIRGSCNGGLTYSSQ